MVTQEPVKASIWHSLNSYCYSDAIFLAERLFAELHNEEILYLLATCYHRAGHTTRAYHLLKKNVHTSIQNRYLFAMTCYILNKLPEAEKTIVGSATSNTKLISTVASNYGGLAGVTLQLLGNIYRKSYQTKKAAECFKHSLKCNPFLWVSFQNLCELGEKVDPLDYFKTSSSSKIPQQQNYFSFNVFVPKPEFAALSSYEQASSENLDPAKATPLLTSTVISKPQQDLSSSNNNSRNSLDLEMAPPPPVDISNRFISKARQRILGAQVSDSPLTPSFGLLPTGSPDLGSSPMFITPPVTALCCKQLKAPSRKAGIKKTDGRTSSLGFKSMGPPSNKSTPSNDAENIGLRRSSRLFSSHSSTKDLKRTPKVHFADKPTVASARKTKSRIARVTTSQPLTPTTQNIIQSSTSVKSEEDLLIKDNKPATLPSPIQQSADGLMTLLKDIGKAYYALMMYDCRRAITLFDNLPLHQLSTSWVMEKLAVAYYEAGEMKLAEKAFEKVRDIDPFYIEEGMAVYTSLLWLSRKEYLLSSVAQDLVDREKNSPVSWCAMANCFSLQKDHDLAIKFLERAIRLNPEFTYAYSLLGHEYVYTEEFDRALSCFRTALRYNDRHYNAWYGIGMIYYKKEKYVLAEQHYQLALKINPNSSILLCHLAVTQHDLDRTEQALETITKANEINPTNALCKYHKARFLLALDKIQDALNELEGLRKIVPKDSLVYFMLGKTYQRMGEPHKAQMNFSWAMSLDPQGTNTMIKEAMNQQHYVTDDTGFMHQESSSQHSLQPESIEDDQVMSDVEENDL